MCSRFLPAGPVPAFLPRWGVFPVGAVPLLPARCNRSCGNCGPARPLPGRYSRLAAYFAATEQAALASGEAVLAAHGVPHL